MMLEDVLIMFGRGFDYMDARTGNIYALTEMFFDKYENVTRVPVYRDDALIGYARMEGNYCEKG